MKRIIPNVIVVTTLFLALSCSSDSDDPMPPTGPVTYEDAVKAIIDGQCLACHIDPPVNGAPFALTNYDQVSSQAALILTSISRQSGTTAAMPPSRRLPQSNIDIIEQWIQDGTLEN